MITALIRSLMCDPKERLQKTSKKVKEEKEEKQVSNGNYWIFRKKNDTYILSKGKAKKNHSKNSIIM